MFMGYSPETVDFLWGIRLNNNREWFLEHKKDYVKYLYEPTKAMGKELFQPFLEKSGELLKVSRIYRDARMHHPVPYKESLWICIRQDVEWWAENPCLYFEINPDVIHYGFVLWRGRPAVMKQNKVLYATLIAFAVFGISIQIFMPYLILYYQVSLHMEDYVLIMAPAIILASIATAFYGRLYDRVGFARSAMPALGLLLVGYGVLYFFRATVPVFIGSLLMMTGYLAGMAVFGAMLRDYTPENKAGMFQGLRIVGQVLIPGIIGPAIGSAVLKNADTIVNDDGTTSFIPNVNIFLAAAVVAVLVFVALIPILKLKKGEKASES